MGLARYRLIQKVLQLLGAIRVAQLLERLGLYLADALAGDSEVSAHLLQRPAAAVFQAEPKLQHPGMVPQCGALG